MTQPRLVGDRYELGELIGYGGMAEVHRGRDVRLGREVAIKVLRADLARDPSFLNRFRREAQAAAGLNYPAIVAVYDTGEDLAPDGGARPFIVMEYVSGRTLRDIVRSEGALPAPRAMEITSEICGALEFSHRNGIVHRDIKPANVMITDAGAVKVMDFGIARAVADDAATVTQTANVIGTAQYLSPEQARGESVDARSDVYSTGCLLYELITGVPPFQGDSPLAVAVQHVRETAVPPSARNPEVPRTLDSIVMKALAKNQLNRYQSAGEMRADLQRALADRPVTAEAVMTDEERTQLIERTPPPVPPGEEEGSGHRRAGLIWAGAVVALLAVIALVSYLVVFRDGSNKTPKVAIPNVVGQQPAQAAQALRNQGLVPQQGNPTSGACTGGQSVDPGKVCTIDPAPSQKVKKGSVVTYEVYELAKVVVPQLQGLSWSDAYDKLQQEKLKPVQKPVDSSLPANTVISSSPAAGSSVTVGTQVTVTVSKGTVILPNVVGQPQAAAVQTLNSKQFTSVDTTQTTTTPDKTKAGTVASESPTPNIAYPTSQQVTLVIYVYKAPLPTCSSSPPTSPSSPSSPTSPTSPSVGPSSSTSGATSPGAGGTPQAIGPTVGPSVSPTASPTLQATGDPLLSAAGQPNAPQAPAASPTCVSA